MSERGEGLKVLDQLEAPDLWDEIAERHPTGPAPSPPRNRIAVTVVALAASMAALLFAWLALRPGEPPQPGGISPGEVVRIPVDGAPQPIAVGEGAAWVSVFDVGGGDLRPGSLWRIDAETYAAEPIPGTEGAVWIAVGEGAVWFTCEQGDAPSCPAHQVKKLDPLTGEVVAVIDLPGFPQKVAVGQGVIWVATSRGLVKVDPQGAAVIDVFPEMDSWLLEVTEGSVWTIASYGLVRIDPQTGEEVDVVGVPDPCTHEASRDALWVATCGGGSVQGGEDLLTRVDPRTGTIDYQTPLSGYGQIREADGRLWLARNDPAGDEIIELVELDPETGAEIGHPVRVRRGPEPPGIVPSIRFGPHVFMETDDRSVWMTDLGGRVIRVGLPPER